MKSEIFKEDSGSILLEYLLLTMFVGCVLLVMMKMGFYSFETRASDTLVNVFGIEILIPARTPGLQLMLFFQRLQTGIAMPVP